MKRSIIFFGCLFAIAQIAAAGNKAPMDTPQISCAGGTQVSRSITVCAPNSGTDATGLPAGFSLQWMTCDAYAANGGTWFDSEDLRLSKASFSGNANASRYNLAPGECVTVNVGDFLFDSGASTNSSGNHVRNVLRVPRLRARDEHSQAERVYEQFELLDARLRWGREPVHIHV